jgi:starch phosphorylase
VTRLNHSVEVKVHSWVTFRDGDLALTPGQGATLLGIPHDRPVVGYGGNHVNTLRLWAAGVPQSFNFGEFSSGDYISAVHQKVAAETLTRVLYPDDSNQHGLGLRFVQEYFLVACSLADIIRRFRLLNSDWKTLPDKVAIQLNDTHPALAVAELMRILLDEAKLTWGDAWDLTVRTLSYTNHTLLPEALEKWPIHYFEFILPRHLEIIYEINRRFLAEVRTRHPGDVARLERVSLIEEGGVKKVRMAHLAVVGSHSTNGVAEIHSKLLRERLLADFVDHFPTRFNNKTNGIAHRRWLLLANPELSRSITEAVGDGWILAAEELRKLLPLAEDPSFQLAFQKAKMAAKVRMTDWAKATLGVVLDPETVFDCQVKRIHEYKRQLLNLLHVGVLVDRIRREAGPTGSGACPRTFIFAGKAAPAYTFAKHVIKLIHCVSAAIEADPRLRGRLRVVFLPDYGVTMAERLIPAADVSEQISTAGYEASGTSNMKLMMNGALTMGTRDGATIEMARAAGEQNFFLFGLDAEQVAATRSWYKPSWHYDNEPETHAAVDWLFSNEVVGKEPTVAVPLRDALFGRGDQFMHLADLKAYAAAQAKLAALREKPEAWARMAIVNVASSGKFSSDRSIAEYAKEIWGAKPCRVE